jgi:hypothetical protein
MWWLESLLEKVFFKEAFKLNEGILSAAAISQIHNFVADAKNAPNSN